MKHNLTSLQYYIDAIGGVVVGAVLTYGITYKQSRGRRIAYTAAGALLGAILYHVATDKFDPADNAIHVNGTPIQPNK